MRIEEKIDKYLNEQKDNDDYKSIFTEEGKKVKGERPSKLSFGKVDSDGIVTNLTWKQWNKTNLPDKSSEYSKEMFLQSLVSQIKHFGRKVDYNSMVKRNQLKTFEEKVEWLLKNGAKYTKNGIKAVRI